MLLPYGSFVFFWISTLFLTIYIYLILDLVRYTGVVIQREKGGNRSYYHFGEVNTVICQERVIPAGEWMPSLYKISQMMSWTHIFCFIYILASGMYRTLAALTFVCSILQKATTNLDHKIVGAVYVANEILFNSMLFGTLFVLLDQKSALSYSAILAFLYICFFVKLSCSLWHTSFQILTLLRLSLLTVAAVPAASNWMNFGLYLNERTCYLFTIPPRALCEWIGVFALFCSDVFDLFQLVSILIKKKKNAKTLYMEILERKDMKSLPGLHVITVNE